MARKKYKLEILAPAREEILEIARLHLELVGPGSARRITGKIKEGLRRLQTHPRMGLALEGMEPRNQGYRKLICGDYLCFYRLIRDTVTVYHVADGRRNYKHLFRTLPTDSPQ